MQTNQEPTLSRICLALGALLILAARNGTAQTAPDFVFQVRGGAGCAGTDPGGNITNPEGWSCTITDSSVDYDNSVELSASASGKTLTFGLKGLIDLPDNSDSRTAGVRKDLSIGI